MKKTILSMALLSLASVSNAAVVDLGLDDACNGNGTFVDEVDFNGDTYLRCDLPLSITEGNNTVVLGVESQSEEEDFEGMPIVWGLPGIVVVGNGSVQNANPASVDRTELLIEAGAQIAGAVNSNSALVISRGASINAVGIRDDDTVDPIVFSSLDDNFKGSGEWGGLVLAGFGESNNCPSADSMDSCEMEGVAAGSYYGGGAFLNTTMSSGTLNHVVIAEGGHEVALASEINGLTLYAVNDETNIDNIHVHNNADDGVEFFGGDAAISNVWLTCNEDDSVDWDEGYRGTIEGLYIGQGAGSSAGAGYAFELAGNPNDANAQPKANGIVKNVTVELFAGAPTPDEVFNLKQGTMGSFENILIEGYTGIGCDVITANSSGSFSNLEYDCTPANIPASTSATGFAGADTPFWTAPACD